MKYKKTNLNKNFREKNSKNYFFNKKNHNKHWQKGHYHIDNFQHITKTEPLWSSWLILILLSSEFIISQGWMFCFPIWCWLITECNVWCWLTMQPWNDFLCRSSLRCTSANSYQLMHKYKYTNEKENTNTNTQMERKLQLQIQIHK